MIALAVATLCVFWPVVRCGFLNYDDDGYVTANTHVQQGLNPGNISWAFRTFATANWLPVTWLSLMLDAQIFKSNPLGFHLINLLLHAANTVLLFVLLKRITGAMWRSAMIAALFGWHPLHVESVAWVSERKDVLSAFFFLLTLLVYAKFVEQSKLKNQKSNLFYALTLLFFALGLMSKPMLVTLPFVLLLLDFWPLHRFSYSTAPRLFAEKIPFFVLSIASSIITYIAQKNGETVQTLAAFPVGTRIENASISYVTYLAKTIWPATLAVPYPYQVHLPVFEILVALALVVGISVTVIILARKFPFLFAGWFWFLGMLIPVIGLVQVGQQSMADRYTYLPLIGAFTALVWGGSEIARRLKFPTAIIAMAALIILAALAVRTQRQIAFWQNSETLFRHTLSVTKENYEANTLLGNYFIANRQFDDAIAYYQRAIQIAPDRISARLNLGSAFILTGKLDDAVEQFNEVVRVAPANADVWCNLGFVCASRRQYDDAITDYNKAIQSKPDFASAFHNRGLAYEAENNWTNAIADYRSALQFDPNHASTHKHLGIALTHIGQTNQAVAELNRAVQLNPNDAEAVRQLKSLQK